MRFVTLRVTLGGFVSKTWVFDTLGQRRFRATTSSPDCQPGDVGGGVALWHCDNGPVLTDLATSAARQPAGWAGVEAMEDPYTACGARLVGRYWLEGDRRGALGPRGDPFFLNHRTGFLNHRTGRLIPPRAEGVCYAYDPSINLDYAGSPPRCTTPRKSWLHMTLPPLSLQACSGMWTTGTNTATSTSTANSGCGAVASSTPTS